MYTNVQVSDSCNHDYTHIVLNLILCILAQLQREFSICSLRAIVNEKRSLLAGRELNKSLFFLCNTLCAIVCWYDHFVDCLLIDITLTHSFLVIWRWHHGTGLSSIHVMAWCLMEPIHYMNQLLLINEATWHSSEGSFSGSAEDNKMF